MSAKIPDSTLARASGGSFHEAARNEASALSELARDAVTDGSVSPLESALLQDRLQRYERDLEAYVETRNAYADAAEQIVGNMKA